MKGLIINAKFGLTAGVLALMTGLTFVFLAGVVSAASYSCAWEAKLNSPIYGCQDNCVTGANCCGSNDCWDGDENFCAIDGGDSVLGDYADRTTYTSGSPVYPSRNALCTRVGAGNTFWDIWVYQSGFDTHRYAQFKCNWKCTCTNDCTIGSSRECGTGSNAGKYRTCVADANGCGVWDNWVPCTPGTTCSAGVCGEAPQCGDCATAGAWRCNPLENWAQICRLTADGCTWWTNYEFCSQGCSGSQCICPVVPGCDSSNQEATRCRDSTNMESCQRNSSIVTNVCYGWVSDACESTCDNIAGRCRCVDSDRGINYTVSGNVRWYASKAPVLSDSCGSENYRAIDYYCASDEIGYNVVGEDCRIVIQDPGGKCQGGKCVCSADLDYVNNSFKPTCATTGTNLVTFYYSNGTAIRNAQNLQGPCSDHTVSCEYANRWQWKITVRINQYVSYDVYTWESCERGYRKECGTECGVTFGNCPPDKPNCVKYKCTAGGCINECSNSEDKECGTGSNAGKNRTCGNYDGDSCLEWSAWTACPAGTTCSGGQCVLGPQTEYYWTNVDDERITSANVEDMVNLVANTTKGANVDVTFEIFDEDGISIRDDLTAGTTDANGVAKAEWSIDEDDMGAANACSEHNGNVNFHFVASYNGRADSGESGNLNVAMDCGETECISWYIDPTDEEEKQIDYCPDYGFIADESKRVDQCNQDCLNVSGRNHLPGYIAENPEKIIKSYGCKWFEDIGVCLFDVITDKGECVQSIQFGECGEDGFRDATYTYNPPDCGTPRTERVMCAASMESILPFFSAFNLISAISIIALVYIVYLFKREFA